MTSPSLEAAYSEIETRLGDRFERNDSIREQHGRDESPLPGAAPDAVVWPQDRDDVAHVLGVCSRHRVPVIPFGAGTSLEGHVLATSGGISVDMTRMDEIVAVNVSDLDAVVQPGVTRKKLDERLRRDGLFFPVDPGADATIGGMAATGASGTTTVRYGAMRANVLSLEVVLASGEIIRTGGRARKSSAGYDLTHLFVGSEGTLGVITEISLRVYGVPEAISAAVATFVTINEAVQTATAVLQLGIPVARVELLDELAMKSVNDYSGLDYPIGPTLFLEFHGSPTSVVEDAASVNEIALSNGAVDFRSAIEAADRTLLWRARHDHFYASLALRPGAGAITTDVCVPISHLAECIEASHNDIRSAGLTATTAGHVGDGNFHLMLLVDPADEKEIAAAEEVNAALIRRALEIGGTCTGEHGIGLRKLDYLEDEMGPALETMRSIKRALDPAGIMNPGKVIRPG